MGIESSVTRPVRNAPSAAQQCAGAVLMIRPAAFGYNPQTAASNKFQKPAQGPAQALALAEFDQFVNALSGEGVRVCVQDDTPLPVKPDAIFPNNWASFHADGTVVLYPMQAENRRLERRPEIVELLASRYGYRVSRIVDLIRHEADGRFLEGTGSLVLDHRNRLAYGCISPRTHP